MLSKKKLLIFDYGYIFKIIPFKGQNIYSFIIINYTLINIDTKYWNISCFQKKLMRLTMFAFFQLTIEFKVFSIFNVKTEKLFLNNIT